MADFWQVALPAPLWAPLDYAVPDGISASAGQIGCRVEVPLGRSTRIGIISGHSTTTKVPADKIKTALRLIDEEPLFAPPFLAFMRWASHYYHYPLGDALLTGLPKSLREGKTFGAYKGKTAPLVAAPGLDLSVEQAFAVDSIAAAKDHYTAFLLYGVTGSGKTEVYLQSMARILAESAQSQALILVPEIGLTPQTVARFTARFGDIACYHSGMTDKQRLQTWQGVSTGDIRIVIGTRSALFLPFPSLALIIVDEEHDPAFKQQEGFRYHARDLAMVRAHTAHIPIILGSATPSFESLAHVEKNRATLLRLRDRIAGAQLPTVQLLDIRHGQLSDGLSSQLCAAIQAHLDRNEQVLLFLNRRGYAPAWMCYACGWLAPCPRCDIRLTFHSAPPSLSCHHCGYRRSIPTACPQCAEPNLHPVGVGTERLESALAKKFPNHTCLRMDSDTTRRKGALEKQLHAVESGEAQLLIGTQLLTKGHHFPEVTLVGIVDADGGLFSSDFRAVERMGQLITQVAGRAGRAHKLGQVMIQTAQPDHPTLQCLITQGYLAFARQGLEERKMAHLPPFSYLALLRAEAKDSTKLFDYLEGLVAYLQPKTPVQVQGPVMAPMPKKAGYHRAQVLLLCETRPALHQALQQLHHYLAHSKMPASTRWSVDVDPTEMI